MKEITEDQIKEAAEKATENRYQEKLEDMPAFSSTLESASGYIAGHKDGAKWMQEQMQPEWIACKHKVVLPTGDYLLRLEYNGFDCNRQFTVSERQKQLEVPYFNVVAYYKVPNYDPANS